VVIDNAGDEAALVPQVDRLIAAMRQGRDS
jgi:hypothetical protein